MQWFKRILVWGRICKTTKQRIKNILPQIVFFSIRGFSKYSPFPLVNLVFLKSDPELGEGKNYIYSNNSNYTYIIHRYVICNTLELLKILINLCQIHLNGSHEEKSSLRNSINSFICVFC